MPTYIYRARFSAERKIQVIENAAEFEAKMKRSIEAFNGTLIKCLHTADSIDPVGFIDFKSDLDARSWNVHYATQPGVESSTINRLLGSEEMQEIGEKLKEYGAKLADS